MGMRELNIQLFLNMLSPEQRASSQSRLESILFAEMECAGIDVTTTLKSALGSSSILQIAETKRIVA